MKVYLEKAKTKLPMYGDVPDLTQGDTTVVGYFEITDKEAKSINELFVDQTNALCDAALDLGDYQYYNTEQCKKLLNWVNETINNENDELKDFLIKLEGYLQYAIANNTGIAIEL